MRFLRASSSWVLNGSKDRDLTFLWSPFQCLTAFTVEIFFSLHLVSFFFSAACTHHLPSFCYAEESFLVLCNHLFGTWKQKVIPPEPSFFQAEQILFSLPLFIRHVLYSPEVQFVGVSLFGWVFLYWGPQDWMLYSTCHLVNAK